MPASRQSKSRKQTASAIEKPGTLLAQWMGMLGKLAVEELDDLDPEIGRLVNRLKEIAGGSKGRALQESSSKPARARSGLKPKMAGTSPVPSVPSVPAAEAVVEVKPDIATPKAPRAGAKKPLGRKPRSASTR